MTVCPLCSGKGFVLAAPVEDGNTLGHPNVRNAYVGTFAPVPCFACNPYPIFMEAS